MYYEDGNPPVMIKEGDCYFAGDAFHQPCMKKGSVTMTKDGGTSCTSGPDSECIPETNGTACSLADCCKGCIVRLSGGDTDECFFDMQDQGCKILDEEVDKGLEMCCTEIIQVEGIDPQGQASMIDQCQTGGLGNSAVTSPPPTPR
jgi:hypothetical protein